MAGPRAAALGQRGQVDQAGVQPVVVGVLGGQGALDLVVGDHPALRGVQQEHPAGLEAALGDHVGGRDVQHADLGGEHDHVVLGPPPAPGAQAVAVQDRADQRAVGEADAGGPSQGSMTAEWNGRTRGGRRPSRRGSPTLGDHHQHRVRQRAARQVQQLEHLVEGGRVAEVGGGDREDALQAELGGRAGRAVEEVGGELGLAGPHAVAVALDGVDLAVVRDARKGCASGQLGKVLVENRLCTSAIAEL